MSGKAGELIPTYRKKILPVAPPTGPSRPKSPTWVARAPTPEGLEAMKKCLDIVLRMRAASRAEREQCGGSKLSKKHPGGFVWLLVFLAPARREFECCRGAVTSQNN